MCGIRAESTLVRTECYTGKSTHLVDYNSMRTDSDSARIPCIPCGIRAEYMGECKDLDSNRHTDTKKKRPDYGFLKDAVCPFRGEEKPSESRDDPKAELSDNLTWTYSPAPYVFGEHNYLFVSPHYYPSRVGYYAIGPDLTLTAICAPSTPS